MPDPMEVEDTENKPLAHPLPDEAELSDQELDNVNGAGGQPHMTPPTSPSTPPKTAMGWDV